MAPRRRATSISAGVAILLRAYLGAEKYAPARKILDAGHVLLQAASKASASSTAVISPFARSSAASISLKLQFAFHSRPLLANESAVAPVTMT